MKPSANDIEYVEDIQVYVAIPTQRDTGNGVLLIHEWWGLVDHVKKWADHFASLGYRAAALDLFDGKTSTDPAEAAKLMEAADPEECLRKISTVLTWMRDSGGLEAKQLATVGWCFGGGLSLQSALRYGDRLSASVIYYGALESDAAKLKGCKVPLLGIFAGKDTWITPAAVTKFEEAARKAGVSLETHEYPDNDHGFATLINKNHDPKAKKDAEEKVAAFLSRTLK